jgi:hypothetical protein
METVPHVVLEYDKWSDCALVALTDDARSAVRGGTDMPYLVTSGYHRESRTWARATPFGDITRATFGGTAAWPVYRGHKN